MNSKFDKTSSLEKHHVSNTSVLQPDRATQQKIVQGHVVMHSQTSLSVIEVFKKRLDYWQPMYGTPFEKQYQLDQLFNHYLTLNDLKSNIHTLRDLTDILTHPKLSITNRYILFNALAAVFPESSNINTIPEPFCDDTFMALLIKNSDDLKTILNLITAPLDTPTIFLQWVKAKSPYLQGIIDKNHPVGRSISVFRQMFAEDIPPAPVFSQTESLFLDQPVLFPMTQYQQSPHKALINLFIRRIKDLDKGDISSFKNFQDKLFDNDLSVTELKKSIQNLEDLLDIFKEGSLMPQACYSLFNYIISVFPLPKNNGNLRAHPCDEELLGKIIKNRDDLKSIYSFMSNNRSRNFIPALERRLSHSPHCAIILQSRVIPQSRINGLNCFFPPSIELNTPSKPGFDILAKPVLVDLTDHNARGMNFEDQESDPVIKSLKRKPLATTDDPEESVIQSRPSKRQKENPAVNPLNLNTNHRGPEVKERSTIMHPLGQLSSFFANKARLAVIAQEPEGGEYDYLLDDHGNVVGLVEPK
ncbi:hypothetical protein [Legionella parisiensis]|uniref:Uncharacterized protein n=1 Tax=Legionella parisiensis TaxID=45071 RepID=A0A1E5JVX5_9GAMM|nr:hypothetical protein [Legionella parisiensis]KTD41286.1 hypothetical protein Lpar_2603 [Legionella parisiensis]OEH48669.1 hypothetical protein lpari_00278 [Legionella parisiensis]STX76413.1 Uncharacterised protein [Legionella parisiensis]